MFVWRSRRCSGSAAENIQRLLCIHGTPWQTNPPQQADVLFLKRRTSTHVARAVISVILKQTPCALCHRILRPLDPETSQAPGRAQRNCVHDWKLLRHLLRTSAQRHRNNLPRLTRVWFAMLTLSDMNYVWVTIQLSWYVCHNAGSAGLLEWMLQWTPRLTVWLFSGGDSQPDLITQHGLLPSQHCQAR